MIVMDTKVTSDFDCPTIGSLIAFGMNLPAFSQRILNPGEAKTKLAFLSFSSGTTGLPKEGVQPIHSEPIVLSVQVYRLFAFRITMSLATYYKPHL